MSEAGQNARSSNSVITFNCTFCGRQIRVPSIHAGKKGKCPKCKNIIVIPQFASSPPSPQKFVPPKSDTVKREPPLPSLDLLLQQTPEAERPAAPQPDIEKEQQFEMLRESAGLPSLEPTPPPKRKFPWLIDIFLYPASISGLISIGIIIALPLLVDIAAWLLGPLGFFISIPGFFFVKIPIALFLLWYFCQCISDSAQGGIRAPEAMAAIPDSGQIFDLVFTWLIFWFPPILYSLLKYPPHRMLMAVFTLPEGESVKDILVYIIQNDIVFGLLWFYAIYFFPMALLGVILYESLTGLNPLLIIRSILSTFFKYFLVVAVFYMPIIVLLGLPLFFPNRVFELLNVPLRFAWVWLLLIVGHLTGRYYYRNEKKLCWGV